jgi:nitrous oxidase accessory protein
MSGASHGRPRRVAAWGLLLAAVQVTQLLGVVSRGVAASEGEPLWATRPVRCREVAGPDLQAALDGEPDAGALCLAPGVYQGPLTLRRGVALWGPPDAILESRGGGTTVRLDDGAALLGLTVAGSGDRFDLLDAAVHVSGRGSRVEGVRVRGAAFGIVVERAAGAIVRGNEVVGDRAKPLGLRGDGIRLWETYDSLVEDNRVRDGRDVVLWYSSGNRLVRNRIEGGRYGAHLMYSHRNEIAGNRFAGNVTGLFVMYSRDVAIRGNVLADSHGAAGIGLGLKESGNLQIEENLVVHNTIGFYVDASPLWPDDRNRFAANVLRLNGVAVSFLGRAEGNDFLGNTFRDSQVHVQVDGRGDAREATWRGNAFDDYVGYDLDGDGTGDVPHELRSLASDLVAEAPALAFFRGTAALALAEAIGRIVPLFEPRLVLVDSEPRMTGADLGGSLAD